MSKIEEGFPLGILKANIGSKKKQIFLGYILFLSFHRVLNVIYSFLGNSPASEF